MRTRNHHSITLRLVVIIMVVCLTGSAVSASAAPTNAAIEKKRQQAAAADSKLQDLSDEVELRGEEQAEIEEAVLKTRQQISVTEVELEKANADLARSQALLDGRVSSIYRNGNVDVLSVLVGASDFTDFINRLDLMRRIGNSDAAIVSSVKEAKANVEISKRSLEARQAEQIALRAEARAKATEAEEARAKQLSYLNSLKSDLKQLMEKERKRQEAIAARLRAEAEARARATARRNTPSRPFTGTLGEAHAQVVHIAEKYLGVPYVWGGTTPSGFDCSGLMQYSYRQVGISLPRTSRLQFHVGDYIPPDRLDLLEAGDLVFFGRGGDAGRIHHVGMYVGGGVMIEAPYTGARVRRSSLIARINSRGDYVGGCRP